MPLAVTLAGFLGGWLLVAGPLYQAALELDGDTAVVGRAALDAAMHDVVVPRHASPWWWLLPPVAYAKQRRQTRRFRRAALEAMSAGQVEEWVHFNEKATGWLVVTAGALLLALNETWELVDRLEWASWTFWVLVVVAAVLCALHTAVRQRRSRDTVSGVRADSGDAATSR